ncbi:unnamed protein product [Caenorhabditis auriculariae]|uniref:Uncharacterized protein n=1 Tax=Caenorhabditis auriculariae TaxID=2777116 RepID=A0A8S1HQG0_9PELO|nr:unnamed protein product [Caenorhabditis auriculariae]
MVTDTFIRRTQPSTDRGYYGLADLMHLVGFNTRIYAQYFINFTVYFIFTKPIQTFFRFVAGYRPKYVLLNLTFDIIETIPRWWLETLEYSTTTSTLSEFLYHILQISSFQHAKFESSVRIIIDLYRIEGTFDRFEVKMRALNKYEIFRFGRCLRLIRAGKEFVLEVDVV